ncbi:hypothetical protein LSCM1_02719 [Leishmania martiniquensis]|uniref:HIT-type domain-containing protein n=1 Tax=Leishmania martiniquensis TaxID=1580590 RepID=A0A836FUD4_9TRYP|nr:hypothetical protein LSCM1_02719 [Leishmania martiniquensis]
MRCIVCDADKASYRCRMCRSPYCSSKCYRTHRMTRAEAVAEAEDGNAAAPLLDHLCEAVLAAQLPGKEREEKRQRTEAEADVFSDVSREKMVAGQRSEHSASPSAAPGADSATAVTEVSEDKKSAGVGLRPRAPEECAGDADAVYILQEKHLSALANHPRVRSALRSASLQKLIKTIDSSRSRLDALEAAQYNNAEFKGFCEEVMRVIAEVEGR